VELDHLSIARTLQLFERGDLNATSLCQACLDRINSIDRSEATATNMARRIAPTPRRVSYSPGEIGLTLPNRRRPNLALRVLLRISSAVLFDGKRSEISLAALQCRSFFSSRSLPVHAEPEDWSDKPRYPGRDILCNLPTLLSTQFFDALIVGRYFGVDSGTIHLLAIVRAARPYLRAVEARVTVPLAHGNITAQYHGAEKGVEQAEAHIGRYSSGNPANGMSAAVATRGMCTISR
jgi:hypothetical protein